MKSKYPLKSGQLTDVIALKEEDNVFIGQNEFVEPIVVAEPVDDAHAVNKGWVEENFGVTKMIFDFDESMSSLAPLTNPNIELNTLNISIDGNGNILIPDTGIFEISVEVNNSSYPLSTGQGRFTISAQFEGKSSRVTMDQYIKYGGYSSFVAESDNQNGILTVLFHKTTPITNIQGTATVTIKKIK